MTRLAWAIIAAISLLVTTIVAANIQSQVKDINDRKTIAEFKARNMPTKWEVVNGVKIWYRLESQWVRYYSEDTDR